MNKLDQDFKTYIMKRFDSKNGTIASYCRAVKCVLEYLNISDLGTAVLKFDEIKMFAYAPKNIQEFKKIYPGFQIGDSYIEKGFVKAAIRHLELFIESKIKERQGVIEERDKIELSKYDEILLEDLLNYKETAKMVIVSQEVRTRVLNRSIINDLKKYYNHRCQICEKQFAMTYDVNICEGHHIEHFAKSFNNSADNIIVLCPDHHRLMHTAKPVLNREVLQFQYDNGYIEKVKLIDHFIKY